MIKINKKNKITIKVSDDMLSCLKDLKVRIFLKKGMELENCKDSVDYIRDNIRDEIKSNMQPKFAPITFIYFIKNIA